MTNEPKKMGLGKFLACVVIAPVATGTIIMSFVYGGLDGESNAGQASRPAVFTAASTAALTAALTPTNTDPKVFVSCEVSRKAIASEDEKLTSYMDSEAELQTDVRFGRRAYTSATLHSEASILIGREEAREKLAQLYRTASGHGCP